MNAHVLLEMVFEFERLGALHALEFAFGRCVKAEICRRILAVRKICAVLQRLDTVTHQRRIEKTLRHHHLGNNNHAEKQIIIGIKYYAIKRQYK